MPELTRPCSRCSRPIPADSVFCPLCGADQPSQSAADAPTSMLQSGADAPTSLIQTGGNASSARSTSRPRTEVDSSVPIKDRLQAALSPGFELGEQLGQGAFGVVFRARDVRLKRDVAVKLLRRELVADGEFVERFEREAQALAALRHPNIVPVYAIGDQDDLIYLVMPFVNGMTLSEYLKKKGSLPLAEGERILTAIGSALSAAHAVGLVHRDIKPDNIMLEGPEQLPLLMDFGIAKAGKSEGVGLTSTGMVLGTPLYMSPEQATASPVDQRSDIYSLGVLAYQLFTGSLPFSGDSIQELLGQHLMTPAPEARTLRPEIPQRISAAVRRAMAKRPAERFQKVEEFLEALSGQGPALPKEKRAAPKGSRLVAAGLALLLLVAGGAAFWKGSARVARVPIHATLRAEGVRFRTAALAPLWDKALVLTSLGLSGLDAVTVPGHGTKPAETVTAPTLFLTAVHPDSGGISIDPVRMPASSVIGVKPTGQGATVQLSLGDTVPSIPVSVSGPIALRLPDRPVDTVPFKIDQIQLTAPPGALDLELGFAGTAAVHPLAPLQIVGVSFEDVNRFRDEESAGDQRVSMITSGTVSVAVGHRAADSLAKGQDLPLHGFQGTIRDLAVDSEAVALTLDGTVDSLPPSLGQFPTLLDVSWAEHPAAIAAAGLVYLGLLALAGLFWRNAS